MRGALLAACRQAHEEHGETLLQRGDVIGTAVGLRRRGGVATDQPVVTVFVARKLPPHMLSPAARLPGRLSGGGGEVETDVVELQAPTVPPAVAHTLITAPPPSNPSLALPRRPIVAGASIAHWDFGIGTATAGVLDLTFGRHCVLSCNHVLARMNHGRIGDAVLQPAPDDGGWYPGEAAGWLLRYARVRFDGTPNHVDAAIAACWPGSIVNQVEGLGMIHQSRPASDVMPGEHVIKVGRTTGLTHGTVTHVAASVKANYAALGFQDRPATFVGQIVADIPADTGDSGSLLVDHDHRAIGMLFGGLRHQSWFNPFSEIEHRLGIRLLPPPHVWI